MVPARVVVAAPHRGVALHARVARARDDERAAFGRELGQALEARARHLHAIDVVIARVRARIAVAIVFHVESEGLLRALRDRRLLETVGRKDRGFVHVVPETGDAFVERLLVQRAPPRARLRIGEIGKRADAGPDFLVQFLAGRVAHIDARVAPAAVDRIVGIELHSGIDDRHRMEAVAAQIGEHLLRLGEGLRVPGEDAVAVHVVDVEMDHVGRDLLFAERVRDFGDFVLRHIRIARLLIAERPQRRQRGAAGQRGVVAQHVRRSAFRAAREHVVVQLAAVGAEGVAVRIGLAHVEDAAPGVVEEHTVALAVAQRDEERNGLVERVRA